MRRFFALWVISAVLLGGCISHGRSAEVTNTVTILEQQAFSNCPVFVGTTRLKVFDSNAWSAHLLQSPVPPQSLAQWSPDWLKHTVVLMALRSRPTTGYAIGLQGPTKRLNNKLVVSVKTSAPKEGLATGSAFTSPCIYALIEATEIDQVDVVDTASGGLMQRWSR